MPLLPPYNDTSRIPYQEGVQLVPASSSGGSSICVTGVMSVAGSVDVPRRRRCEGVADDTDENATSSMDTTIAATIRYRLFRPRQLSTRTSSNSGSSRVSAINDAMHVRHLPPLVVLHGGPSVPANYLYSLVNVVVDRAILFYDQVGCGKSSRPSQLEAYSIPWAVKDLQALLHHLQIRSFHLYGHSFGGILAYEYLKTQKQQQQQTDTPTGTPTCHSLILSSTPTNIRQVQQESERLMDELRHEWNDELASSSSSSAADKEKPSSQQQLEQEQQTKRELSERFRQRHECRIVPTPLALEDAHAQAGTVWRGMDAISDYHIAKPHCRMDPDKDGAGNTTTTTTHGNNNNQHRLPQPVLVLRGQHDFVTQPCIDGWQDDSLFHSNHITSMVLAGCSHHGLLENEGMYGAVVSAFLQDHDPT